jgi:hypothetical protein
MCTLAQVAQELRHRLASIFVPDRNGRRACHGDEARYAHDPHWRDLVLFYEYFHGDTGRGLGASHQTGWTALVERCLDDAIFREQTNGAHASARRSTATTSSTAPTQT